MFVNQFGYADIADTHDLGLFQNLALVSPGLRHHQAVFGIAVSQFPTQVDPASGRVWRLVV